MTGEIDLYGVFVPTLLVCSVIALVLLGMVRRLLGRFGFYRLVWHEYLANLALFVIILAVVTAGLQRWMS